MAKNAFTDWSTTASDNTDIAGIALSDQTRPTDLDDITREMMAQLRAGVPVLSETARLNQAQTWTATQTFSAGPLVSGSGVGGSRIQFQRDGGDVLSVGVTSSGALLLSNTTQSQQWLLLTNTLASFPGAIQSGGNPVASVYTGSNANETDFPIGTTLLASLATPGDSLPARNSVVTIRLNPGSSAQYVWGSSATGTVLQGTWRNRGGAVSGGTILMERVA